jgi:hypothetical protein
MDIGTFIQSAAEGNAIKAKEAIYDVLSNRAFEALDAEKKEIAKSLYATGDEQVETQDTEETEE